MSLLKPYLDLLALSLERPLIMGVLNVTPDSFSDGGSFLEPGAALARCREMLAEGADLIDVGGESTRPGAAPVSERDELARVLPVAQALARELPKLAWSIDTQKAAVAAEALRLGASLINDVSALRQDPGMAPLAAQSGCGVILMHRGQAPQDARWSTEETADYRYHPQGVCGGVSEALEQWASRAMAQGVSREALWVDPGLGFGKSVADNFALMAGFRSSYPVLMAPSRKSFIGAVLGGLPESERLEGTAAAVCACVMGGARMIRVHDVKEMARVAKVAFAVRKQQLVAGNELRAFPNPEPGTRNS